MEKKKNNAVEKAEKVAKKNDKDRTAKTQGVKKQQAKKSVQNAKKEKQLKREKIKAEKERIRLEREKAEAQKRIELAKIKAHKKAERQKAKAAALRERNRRNLERKKHIQELKAEREQKRQMLKNESKKERIERKAQEREQKRQAYLQLRRQKAQERKQKLQERQEKRQARRQNRENRKGYGGWLAAVISLGVVSLVLASVLTFTFLMPTAEDNMLESGYRKNFYDTVEQIDNIDLNLSKALATADSGALQQYLVDTAINSELAENDLQQLPLHDESKHYTTKLINQIGDYAKYLNKKIIAGEKLNDEDYQALSTLYRANLELKNSLQDMIQNMGDNFSFSSMLSGNGKNLVVKGFDQLQNLSVQYPELIYDGPFSDGLTAREIKGLKGAQIDENFAKEKFNKIFSNYGLESVQSVGSSNGEIECYNIQAQVKGDLLYAQISKNGGELIMFAYAGSCNGVYCDEDRASEVASEFISSLGIKDMKPVWINLANNVYTINFALEKGGVIVYSDLIKVRVCAETQMVIGLEARSYYTNHTERVIGSPVLSKSQSAKKVSSNIELKSCRLALVPIGTSSEKLCYEFSGEYDGSTYYIYIDAITGRQAEMFKVIESTEGTLLI